MHVELREDVGDVVALGAQRDVKPVRDCLAVEAVGQELKDFLFPPSEAFDGLTVGVLLFSLVPGVAK